MPPPVKNLLLDAYVKEAGPGLLSRFEAVPMPFKALLFAPDKRPAFVHFLTSGMSSLVALLSEGAEVEVAMVGREGFPEAVHLLGPAPPLRNCLMQVEGTALRMPLAEFNSLFQSDAILRRLVLQCVQYQSLAASQLVACNGQHEAEARLARWLLMVQDRVGESYLPLTQEFLGQMLGARRSTVTIAASNLQRTGMIDYHRGNVRITDRERLVETACECYGIIKKLFDALYTT